MLAGIGGTPPRGSVLGFREACTSQDVSAETNASVLAMGELI